MTKRRLNNQQTPHTNTEFEHFALIYKILVALWQPDEIIHGIHGIEICLAHFQWNQNHVNWAHNNRNDGNLKPNLTWGHKAKIHTRKLTNTQRNHLELVFIQFKKKIFFCWNQNNVLMLWILNYNNNHTHSTQTESNLKFNKIYNKQNIRSTIDVMRWWFHFSLSLSSEPRIIPVCMFREVTAAAKNFLY